jgi:ribulose-5-phosphate 4-epimerase/fuculose-1-phosphate aldolase
MPDNEHMLVNALGVLYHEIAASNLVRVSLATGTVDDPANTINACECAHRVTQCMCVCVQTSTPTTCPYT